MPIFTNRPQPSWRLLAALLLPAWLRMSNSPTASKELVKEALKDLENTLKE